MLDLQGDVDAHLGALAAVGAAGERVRRAAEVEEVDGLILPGGESTTIGMLLERFGIMEPLRERIAGGMPVLGTCAGMILLARDIEGSPQPRIGTMDITVLRNGYGRQVDSFETDLEVPALGAGPVRAVFIRAPRVTRTGAGVEVLAAVDGEPVAVRQGSQTALAFHPELSGDWRFHAWFVEQAASRGGS